MTNGERESLAVQELLRTQWGIRFGIPAAPQPGKQFQNMGWEIVPPPIHPHVFLVKTDGINVMNTQLVQEIDNAMVIFGHAIATDNDKYWNFLTNKPVHNTTQAYERLAKDMDWPSIDVAIACRGNKMPKSGYDPESNSSWVPHYRPLIIQSLIRSPQIYPGSMIMASTSWSRRGGLDAMSATAMEWHSIELWQQHWGNRQKERASRKIPDWAVHASGSTTF